MWIVFIDLQYKLRELFLRNMSILLFIYKLKDRNILLVFRMNVRKIALNERNQIVPSIIALNFSQYQLLIEFA